mgnify:CR=1 FL=1
MKKIKILLTLIVLFTLNSYAQLRVYSNGNIGIQNDSTSINSPLVVGNGSAGANGIAIVEIVLSRPEDQLKDKEKDILVAVRTLAKNIAETCQS